MSRKNNKSASVAVVETVAPELNTVPDTNMSLESLMGDLAALEDETAKLAEAEAAAKVLADAAQAEADALKALEPATEEPVVEEIAENPVEIEHVPGDLKEMLAEVSADDKAIMRSYVHDAFDRRLDYEQSKNGDNLRMEKNLKSYADKMTRLPLCGVLVATDVDPDFINRSIAEGKRYNVYAIEKVNDLLMGLETGRLSNAINIAVCKSLFAFRAAGVPFTGLMAIAAASDKAKVDDAMKKLLTRHTVAEGTAPTQASSSMSALQTLGIVVNRGSQKFPVWQLTDTPQTRALEVAAA